MKKLLLIALLAVGCFNQVEAKKQFVEMEFYKNTIQIDNGTNEKRHTLKDADGKALKFKSLAAALNYMSLQGWELVDTKSVTTGSGSITNYGGSSSTKTAVYYLFSKDVSDGELAEAVRNGYLEK
ncbi:MAG: hypothetical protein HDS72_07530 [Bacteroidales bacterium]|nr:hypothetical protein [Bacteroidales bacterium]